MYHDKRVWSLKMLSFWNFLDRKNNSSWLLHFFECCILWMLHLKLCSDIMFDNASLQLSRSLHVFLSNSCVLAQSLREFALALFVMKKKMLTDLKTTTEKNSNYPDYLWNDCKQTVLKIDAFSMWKEILHWLFVFCSWFQINVIIGMIVVPKIYLTFETCLSCVSLK